MSAKELREQLTALLDKLSQQNPKASAYMAAPDGEGTPDRIRVVGVAVEPGVYTPQDWPKPLHYDEKELRKASKSIIGSPIRMSIKSRHVLMSNSQLQDYHKFGIVDGEWFKDGKQYFEGFVTKDLYNAFIDAATKDGKARASDFQTWDSLVSNIRNGVAVSAGIKCDVYDMGTNYYGRNMKYSEVCVVPVGACPTAWMKAEKGTDIKSIGDEHGMAALSGAPDDVSLMPIHLMQPAMALAAAIKPSDIMEMTDEKLKELLSKSGEDFDKLSDEDKKLLKELRDKVQDIVGEDPEKDKKKDTPPPKPADDPAKVLEAEVKKLAEEKANAEKAKKEAEEAAKKLEETKKEAEKAKKDGKEKLYSEISERLKALETTAKKAEYDNKRHSLIQLKDTSGVDSKLIDTYTLEQLALLPDKKGGEPKKEIPPRGTPPTPEPAGNDNNEEPQKTEEGLPFKEGFYGSHYDYSKQEMKDMVKKADEVLNEHMTKQANKKLQE